MITLHARQKMMWITAFETLLKIEKQVLQYAVPKDVDCLQTLFSDMRYFCGLIERAKTSEIPFILETLKNDPTFGKYNLRYGTDSIIGITGELTALWLWNRRCCRTKFVWVPIPNRINEKKGWDLMATNPDWSRSYPVQVKQFKDPNQVWTVDIQTRIIDKYHVDNFDRLVFVNIEHDCMIQVPHHKFVMFFKRLQRENKAFTTFEEISSIRDRNTIYIP